VKLPSQSLSSKTAHFDHREARLAEEEAERLRLAEEAERAKAEAESQQSQAARELERLRILNVIVIGMSDDPESRIREFESEPGTGN
jgi:hypothetical protein